LLALFLFYLIPHPLLPGEKGCKNMIIRIINPSPKGEGFRVRWIKRERGWGEVKGREGFGGWVN